MTLERFLEIINNKEYEKLEYVNQYNTALLFRNNYIDIYTKNGAFIRFRFDHHVEGFFRMKIKPYCDILFFVPEEDIAVSSHRISEEECMYETLKELFDQLKAKIMQEQADEYSKYF